MTERQLSRCRDDVDALFENYRRTGDLATRNRLVVAHRGLAERCARWYQGRGEDLGDLVQVAQFGLIKAVERFDPGRDVAFASFAMPTIIGEIKRHFRDATWPVSVPRAAKDRRARVQGARDALGQQHGRAPTVEEISRASELDPAAVAETLEANRAYRPFPLDPPRPDSDREGREPAGADLRSEEQWFTDAADERLDAVRLIEGLEERDRKIVVWRFYEECTQREIGERLGVGQVQVSRLLRAAVTRMRELGLRQPDVHAAPEPSP